MNLREQISQSLGGACMRQISLFEDENQVDSPPPKWESLPEECRVNVIRAIAALLCRLEYLKEGREILE